MRMCSGMGRELLARIKKINSSSLLPCAKTLSNHIKRAHYVARMWRRAVHTKLFATGLVPRKFCPGVITCASNNMEDASTDDEQSDNAWSDDSDSNYENDEEV